MIDVDAEIARRLAAWRATVKASVEHGSRWFYVERRTDLPSILPAMSDEECARMAEAAGAKTLLSLSDATHLETAERFIKDDVERRASRELAREISAMPGGGGRA